MDQVEAGCLVVNLSVGVHSQGVRLGVSKKRKLKRGRNSRAEVRPKRSGVHGVIAGARDNVHILRFVGVTVVSLIGFFLVIRLSAVQATIVAPYTHFVASSSRVALRLLGIDASGTGSHVASPEFSVNILNVCNGVEVTAILFAVILAFPARWKHKLLGIAVGYPVIFLVNLARIVVLFFLGFKHPDVFDTVHYYYAQAFVILATLSVWLAWVARYSAYGVKSD